MAEDEPKASDGAPDRRRLLERAETDPDAVAPEAIADRTRAADGEEEQLFEAVRLLARSSPETAARTVEALEPLTADAVGVRMRAVAALAVVADERPAAVRRAVPRLLESAREDVVVADEAFAALARVAVEYPEPILDDRPAVAAVLDHDVLAIRADGATLVAALADAAPTKLMSLVPRLTDLATAEGPPSGGEGDDWMEREQLSAADEATLMRREAAVALQRIAAEDSDAVVDSLSPIIEYTAEGDVATVRTHLVAVLGSVAETTPRAVMPALDALVDALRDGPTTELRVEAARTLAILVDGAGGSVASAAATAVPDAVDLLEDADERGRVGVATLLSCVAEHEPESVEPVLPRVSAILDGE